MNEQKPVQENTEGDGLIHLYDLVSWRSKGRGVVNQKMGYIVFIVEANELPVVHMPSILKFINLGELPSEAEWSRSMFREAKVNYKTIIVWGFFKDITGVKRHGFYRPPRSRVKLLEGQPRSIVELFNE